MMIAELLFLTDLISKQASVKSPGLCGAVVKNGRLSDFEDI
jgi:hypothetical protein